MTVKTVQNCFKKTSIGKCCRPTFKFFTEELESLKECCPELVPTSVSPGDIIGTNQDLLTSDIESLTDEDILAEFKTNSGKEQEDSADQIKMLNDLPKRPAPSEVRQSIDTLATYSLFVDESAEEICNPVSCLC